MQCHHGSADVCAKRLCHRVVPLLDLTVPTRHCSLILPPHPMQAPIASRGGVTTVKGTKQGTLRV
eukprot:5346255-Alexandrium_andersonii.AAC.1